MIENQNMSYVVPAAKCELNISNTQQGFLNSVSFFGVVLGAHFWGFMADTWGRKKVLQVCLFMATSLSLVSSLSISTYMLMSLRFMVGLL